MDWEEAGSAAAGSRTVDWEEAGSAAAGSVEDGGPVGGGLGRARSWGPRRRARGDLRAGIRALHHAK